MSLPKKRNINITPGKIGLDRIKQLMDDTDLRTSYLPSGILIKDLEIGMRDFMRELNFTLDGEKVPVIFLPGERWAEFSKVWKYLDQDKNVVMPLIVIKRSEPPQPGSSVIKKWTIPGKKTYTYLRVPTFDGTYRGVDLYKIPQPVPVDIRYEVRFFSHYITDINKFGELVLADFSSRQSYTKVKGRFIPIVLDSIGSEDTIENVDSDRFYVQVYTFTMMGYIQDENEFEISPSVNKMIVLTEVDNDFITISGSTVSGGT